MSLRLSHPAVALVIAFMTVILLGTGLLMLPASQAEGLATPFFTALFTATSAVCVTGLVLVDTGTYWSGLGQAFIMALFQLGGFGMMTSATMLGLLVNRQLRLRSRLMLQAETHSLALGDVRSVARLVMVVTVTVELIGALLLAGRFKAGYDMTWREALWQGLFHSVSAFNNAGFSTWPDSVTRFSADAWVLVPLMLCIIIGGLGFPVLHEVLAMRRRSGVASIHTTLTLWGSGALIVGGTLAFLWAEAGNAATFGALDAPRQVLAALFVSVSARTAGFNIVDVGAFTVESLNLHYLLMFIGGGSAGTAGGVKVTTFFVLLLIVWSEIRGHQDVEFRGRRISTSAQRQALTILVLGAGTVVLATLALVPMVALPYELVLFEVIAAFSTVGLSPGTTVQMPQAGQWVLIVLMFVGRVGVVTLAAAIATNHARRPYRFPEEKPIVG